MIIGTKALWHLGTSEMWDTSNASEAPVPRCLGAVVPFKVNIR